MDQFDKNIVDFILHNNHNHAIIIIIIMDSYKIQLRTGLFVTGKGV